MKMDDNTGPPEIISEISRRNSEGEVTIHAQGSVTEWITSTVSFDRIDRATIRDSRLDKLEWPDE